MCDVNAPRGFLELRMEEEEEDLFSCDGTKHGDSKIVFLKRKQEVE